MTDRATIRELWLQLSDRNEHTLSAILDALVVGDAGAVIALARILDRRRAVGYLTAGDVAYRERIRSQVLTALARREASDA